MGDDGRDGVGDCARYMSMSIVLLVLPATSVMTLFGQDASRSRMRKWRAMRRRVCGRDEQMRGMGDVKEDSEQGR